MVFAFANINFVPSGPGLNPGRIESLPCPCRRGRLSAAVQGKADMLYRISSFDSRARAMP